MPDSTAPTPPPFEQLPALAHVEIDRFCAKCAYNLRGQAIRRELAMALLLCRCPECGAFAPANDASPQFNALARRSSKVLWGLWVFVCLYLIIGAGGAMSAVVIGVVGELAHLDERWRSTSPSPPRQMQELNERLDGERLALRVAGFIGAPLLGLVCGMIWPVIFPHWRRWGYGLLSILIPFIAGGVLVAIIASGELRRVPDGTELLVTAMILGAMLGGLIGNVIGRAAARGVLTLLLTERPRAAFSYLWMIDGKKPPCAKGNG